MLLEDHDSRMDFPDAEPEESNSTLARSTGHLPGFLPCCKIQMLAAPCLLPRSRLQEREHAIQMIMRRPARLCSALAGGLIWCLAFSRAPISWSPWYEK